MSKAAFDTYPKLWSRLENALPSAKEVIEEAYLVLRLMGTSPKIRVGRKSNSRRKKYKSTYSKYMIDANDKKQFTIYVYNHPENQVKIRFYNRSLEEEMININTLEDLKNHLSDWLVSF